MQLSSVLGLLAVGTLAAAQAANNVTTGKLGDARPVRNNPVIGEVWIAEFDSETVKGTFKAVAATIGINYTIDITGLPEENGPYNYHIHVRAVPENGTCADTGLHLDSYVRGQEPPCEASLPATCEVGDLSGKYGKVAGGRIHKEFHDPYTATNIIQLGYIGNRAIVFHDKSSARVACASIKKAPIAPAP
ncbi:superoxide dismutase [Triangularia setosa]|uniref:superoxide dismutase n=1 Tax=Triangularia setosa TaxID=2587417 RepID=A0AAN6WCU3_9PEZI|nr:superoxide dismutase [Podospora setosa]